MLWLKSVTRRAERFEVRDRRPRRNAARCCTQLAIVASVVAASAFVVTTRDEGGAAARPQVLGEGPIVRSDAHSLRQQVTVARPAGQVVLSNPTVDKAGHIDMTLTDTRADDPGWSVRATITRASGGSVSWTPSVVEHAETFTTSDGTAYSQRVRPGANGTLAAAPAGHGLGMAHLRATVVGDASDLVVTVTVA